MLPGVDAVRNLKALADELHKKSRQAVGPLVVCVMGAGASASAGLLLAVPMMKAVREEAIAKGLGDVLNAELVSAFGVEDGELPDDILARISLFDLAALVTRFELGRRCFDDLIDRELKKSAHRPLTYELAA